jgi:hypothetical protein
MAIDLYPYSGRNDGAVSDAEHALLWSGWLDGILPDQPANALQVSVSSSLGEWTVQPGMALVDGHVFVSDSPVTEALSPAGAAARVDAIVARVDYSQSPWRTRIIAREGTPGGGTPTHVRDRNGVYEFLLGWVQRNANGSSALVGDARVWQAGPVMACTSTSRPYGVRPGNLAYEIDTARHVRWDGTRWTAAIEESGWTLLKSANTYWAENADLRVMRRNGWVFLRGSLTRRSSAWNPATDNDPGTLLLQVPNGFRPILDYYGNISVAGSTKQARLNVHADDGRAYFTHASATVQVGEQAWFSETWPGA